MDMATQLIYSQTREEFAEDIRRSKSLLEDIISDPVCGYRAPGFSISSKTPWVFNEISAAGFEYDSVRFPSEAWGHQPKGEGQSTIGSEMAPHRIHTDSGELIEMPISVVPVIAGQRICVFGGGYFRLAPYNLINRMAQTVNKAGRPVIYYLHPREIDPDQPRIDMGLLRRFKSYVNLRTTMPKLRRLLHDQQLISFRDWLSTNREDDPSLGGDLGATKR